MKNSKRCLKRLIAGVLVMLLASPLAEGAATSPQQIPLDQQTAPKQPQDSGSSAAKADADASQTATNLPDSPKPQRAQTGDQISPFSASLSSLEQQQNTAQKPVGTAAAPYEKPTGVAGSKPAGAAIAPAKQKRARSILIRYGVIVGAAAAVGTVVALSHASSSRP